MSSVEITGAGAIPDAERATTPVENVWMCSPDRPADAELALRTVEVYVPVDPLTINGTLFNVAVDQDKLTTAINKVAEPTVGLNYLYPRQLYIGMGIFPAAVEIGEDLQPKITDPGAKHNTPVLTMFEGGGTSINITVPRELNSEDYSEAGLVELVTRQANENLWVALSQNLEAKTIPMPGFRNIIAGLAMGTGEGVGIAIADGRTQMLLYGIIGAVASGAMLRNGLYVADRVRWGAKKNQAAWSIKQARHYRSASYRDSAAIDTQLSELAKEGPVISLNPAQPERAQPEVA